MSRPFKSDYVDLEVVPPGSAPRPVHEGPDSFIWLVSRLLDTVFRVPGTRIRFGLEPIIALVPVLGDQAATLISAALLFRSLQHRLPKVVLARMSLNLAINGLIGMIPVVGDLFILWYKPNVRNYRLLQRYAGQAKPNSRGDWLFVLGIVGVTFFLITVFGAFLGYAVLQALQRPF
ncbi:MAG TPA: DUF4112 domain-containing protein [Chthoniobacterales bacterium]